MLKELVTRYLENKTELDRIKKITDSLNANIKSEMLENNIDKFEEDNVIANLNKQERVTVNQDKLLQKLKDLGITKPVKLVETLDEGVLQDMIYNGELDANIVAECTDTKEVYVLKVKGKKVKK